MLTLETWCYLSIVCISNETEYPQCTGATGQGWCKLQRSLSGHNRLKKSCWKNIDQNNSISWYFLTYNENNENYKHWENRNFCIGWRNVCVGDKYDYIGVKLSVFVTKVFVLVEKYFMQNTMVNSSE